MAALQARGARSSGAQWSRQGRVRRCRQRSAASTLQAAATGCQMPAEVLIDA
jgi:hypothetical protein